MMSISKQFLLLLLIFVLFAPAYSQHLSKGKIFWLTFLENLPAPANGESVLVLTFTGDAAARIVIKAPGSGFVQGIATSAGVPHRYELPGSAWFFSGSDVTGAKGLLIESNQPVAVTAFHSKSYFSEATKIYPVEVLGTTYTVITHQDHMLHPSPNEFAIVSTTDDNRIEITPSVPTDGLRAANVPYVITLNRGESFQVQAKGDLTGTQIRSLSDGKIAVFAGARQAAIRTNTCTYLSADNHIYDQLVPHSLWEKNYIAMPFIPQGITKIKVWKQEAGTALIVNGDTVSGNRNQYDLFITKPTLIRSESKISVAAFTVSMLCNDGKIGDPSMVMLPPLSNFTKKETFFALDIGYSKGATFKEQMVNIVTRTNAAGRLRLDGNVVAGLFIKLDADTSYSTATLKLSGNGFHTLSSDSGFNGIVYGLGDHDAYSYSLGDRNASIIEPVDPSLQPDRDFDAVVYPNPTTGNKLKVQFLFSDSLSFTTTIKLHDLQGRLVLEEQRNINPVSRLAEINTFHLASALYTLTISTAYRNFMFKVVVNNKY